MSDRPRKLRIVEAWHWELYADGSLTASGHTRGDRDSVLVGLGKATPDILDGCGVAARTIRVEITKIIPDPPETGPAW